MKKRLFILQLLIIPIFLFPLRVVREANLLVFYNSKNLKVKAYYIRDNKVEYVYRYYYNPKNLPVRKEIWKKNRLLFLYIYQYYKNKKLKSKKYIVGHKAKYLIKYDKDGEIIEKTFFHDETKKSIQYAAKEASNILEFSSQKDQKSKRK